VLFGDERRKVGHPEDASPRLDRPFEVALPAVRLLERRDMDARALLSILDRCGPDVHANRLR
jgi:hypothetical protein